MKRLRCVVALGVAWLLAAGLAAGQVKQDYQRVKVAEDVYAFIATEPTSGVVQGNVTLIIGENAALLVDSGQFASLARRMAAEVRQLTSKPVRYLVNTHWHGDHLLANNIFRQSFPGLQVIAHQETRTSGDKFYGKWKETVAGFPALVKTLRERVASGKRGDGTPLTPEQKTSLQEDADALEAALPDAQDTAYDPAEITFTKELVLYLGSTQVRVSNLGRANTSGDAVVWVPERKTLVTGDIVVYPTPYSTFGYHGEWMEVLKKLMAMGATSIVPGHGPVMRDTAYLQTLLDLLQKTKVDVEAAVAQGLSLEETRKRVDLAEFRRKLAGDNPHRQRAFRDFYEFPGVARAYKEAKGEALEEPTPRP